MDEIPWSKQFRDAEPVRAAGPTGFDVAVTTFAVQFDARLTEGATDGYDVCFYTTPGSPMFARYRMQGEICYVRFRVGREAYLEAWVECIAAEDQIVVLRWSPRAWSVIGHGMSTQVSD